MPLRANRRPFQMSAFDRLPTFTPADGCHAPLSPTDRESGHKCGSQDDTVRSLAHYQAVAHCHRMGESSYGARTVLVGVWTLFFSPPAVIWGYLFFKSAGDASALPFILCVALALLPAIYASRLRATFTDAEFVYRRWGPTINVPYEDIDCIQVTHVSGKGASTLRINIKTKGGGHFYFFPKPFPREVLKRLLALDR